MSYAKVVSKFGGSSMKDATAMIRSAKIAVDRNSYLVVVSATYGTTNQILELIDLAETGNWEQCEQLLSKIRENHLLIANELSVNEASFESLKTILEELETYSKGVYLLRECSLRAKDSIVGIGERLSSLLFSQALAEESNAKRVELIDSRNVLITSSDYGKASPLIPMVEKKCQETFIKTNCIYVGQGFIGSDEEGIPTTLGRGGSDYSAALLAEGMGADLLEIWTDVAGIATTDPRICEKAIPINEISFKEASELATFGAKILHPTTLDPARRKGIAVFVGSSYEPTKEGTWIKRSTEAIPLVRALAMKRKQSLLTLRTPKMWHSHGFLYQIFKVFNDHGVSVDSVTTSEISVSLTVDDATLLNQKLIGDLNQFAEVKVEENLSLVSLIGNNINHTPGLGKDIFTALDKINVRMICLGASVHNFCFLVDEKDGDEAVRRLHKRFIEV